MSQLSQTTVLSLVLLFHSAISTSIEEELLYDSFPDEFQWGVATAAYQASDFDAHEQGSSKIPH